MGVRITEIKRVKFKDKRYLIDLLNVFSGDDEAATSPGAFEGIFDMEECGEKRLTCVFTHCVGEATCTVTGDKGSVTFSLREGCNKFKLNMLSSAFKIEIFDVSENFVLQRLELRYITV